jgi:hypothetical protein
MVSGDLAFCPGSVCVDAAWAHRMKLFPEPSCVCSPSVLQSWALLAGSAVSSLWVAAYAWLGMLLGLMLLTATAAANSAALSAWKEAIFSGTFDRFAFDRGAWSNGTPKPSYLANVIARA